MGFPPSSLQGSAEAGILAAMASPSSLVSTLLNQQSAALSSPHFLLCSGLTHYAQTVKVKWVLNIIAAFYRSLEKVPIESARLGSLKKESRS